MIVLADNILPFPMMAMKFNYSKVLSSAETDVLKHILALGASDSVGALFPRSALIIRPHWEEPSICAIFNIT